MRCYVTTNHICRRDSTGTDRHFILRRYLLNGRLENIISFPLGWGRGYSTKFYTGMLRPEVVTLIPLISTFDKKKGVTIICLLKTVIPLSQPKVKRCIS